MAGRLWLAMLAGSALIFGAVPPLAEAAEPAPVVERTRPVERGEEGASGGARSMMAVAGARDPGRPGGPDHQAAGRAVVAGRAGAPASGRPARVGQVGAGLARKPASRASSGHAEAGAGQRPSAGQASARALLRSRRLSRPAMRSGLRKITSTGRSAGSVRSEEAPLRLTRAERGVVEHIARKFRVQASSIERYVGYARRSGQAYNVDPYLILAVMATESSFNPRAQSPVGAQGLMQVHTRMHRKRFAPYGSTDSVWEPRVNIQVGSSILSDYLKRYGGSERRALKAYVGAARMSHDGGYGSRVLRRRDEFVSVSVAARNSAASQASLADGAGGYADL